MDKHKMWSDSKDELKRYKVYLELLKDILVSYEGKIDPQKLNEITKMFMSTFKDDINSLSFLTKINQCANDDYMHAIKVALISLIIGRWNNYEEDRLQKLVLVGLVHDIGKYSEYYTKDIYKNNRVMANLIYKRHPIEGYEKLAKNGELDLDVLKAVLTHHEKCDGTGFPLGLRSERISDLAKIVGLANTYDRLREKMHVFDVVKELITAQMGAFELDLVTNFCSNIMNQYIGHDILLSTGEIAKIKEIHQHSLYRPIVTVDGKDLDLYLKRKIMIEKVYYA